MRAMAGRTYSLLRRAAPRGAPPVHVVRPRPNEGYRRTGRTREGTAGDAGPPGRTGPPAWGKRPQLSSRGTDRIVPFMRPAQIALAAALCSGCNAQISDGGDPSLGGITTPDA